LLNIEIFINYGRKLFMSTIRRHGPVSTYAVSSHLKRPVRLYAGGHRKLQLGKEVIKTTSGELLALEHYCSLLAGTQPLPAAAPETLGGDINSIKEAVAKIRSEFNKLVKIFSLKPVGANVEKMTGKIIHDINNHFSVVSNTSAFIVEDLGVPNEDSRAIIAFSLAIQKSGRAIVQSLVDLRGIVVAEPKEITKLSNPNKVQPQTILVVDDDHNNRLLVERILTRQGHTVALAAGAEEALAMNLTRFSIVITDIDMGEMDGLTLAGKIRDLHGGAIKVIVMSGMLDSARRETARVNGAQVCLPKPFSANELLTAIKE